MTRQLAFSVILIPTFFATFVFAGTIHVPADQPTIQSGIKAATNGDTVLVAPGTYNEDINFSGKAITVTSSGGSAVTVVNGTATGPVVRFVSGETSAALLKGFTIQNGNTSTYPLVYGGGILIESSSPIIKNNVINGNQAGAGGNGVAVLGGSPRILNNRITNNFQNSGFSLGSGGGGILVNGGSSLIIAGNTISNNITTASGGGIALYSITGGAILLNNRISKNTTQFDSDGGGLWIYNSPSVQLIQNLIVQNSGRDGGGLFLFTSTGFLAVNNTFASNTAGLDGSAVTIFGADPAVMFYNNLLIGAKGFYAVDCEGTGGSVFMNNDAYEVGSSGLTGTCASQSSTNGNISVDPHFVSKSNYQLRGGSPAIDVGDNAAPSLPRVDLASNPRIINGNGGATAIVDVGAYEFLPVVLLPKSLAFGLLAVGSTTSKPVKLTNAQNKTLYISSYSTPTGYSVSGCGHSLAAFTSCTLTVIFHPLTAGTFKGSLILMDDAGSSPQTITLSGSAQ